MHIHISKKFFICNQFYIKLKTCSHWCFQLQSITTWIILASSSCLSPISHFNSEKRLPPTTIPSHAMYMYSGFWIVSLWGDTLTTRVQCLCTVPFSFVFIDFTHFQSYSALLAPSFSVRLFHTFAIELHYFIIVSFPSWDPMISYLVFKILHILRFNRCSVKLGFDKCIVSCTFHHSTTCNSYIALKSSLASPTQPSLTLNSWKPLICL